METQLEPVGQRIIVKRLSQDQTRSGLIVPDQAKRGTFVGEVLAKGPEAEWVEVGQKVMFGKYSGWEFPVDRNLLGEKYTDCLVMNCEDVLMIVNVESAEAPK